MSGHVRGQVKQLRRTEDDHTGRSISTLFILRPTQLNHVLCRRMRNVNLAENGIPVVREPDACQ